MASKEPREVAGLGRAETPQEKADRIQKARAERKARQNMRNLVWSLLTSLAVVAALVFVVARPDTNLVTPVEWREIAEQAADQAPGALVVPDLSDQWSANRAEISGEPGTTTLWSIGFLGPDQSFVFLDQGFGATEQWLSEQTRQSPKTGTIEVAVVDTVVVFDEYDRQDTDPSGNHAYLLVHETPDAIIVIGGTTPEAVVLMAEAVAVELAKR